MYLGGRLFEWTRPFLDLLRRRGIGRTFFTNNSSKSTKQYVEHLQRMGIDARFDEIQSSTTTTIEYLKRDRPELKRLFVLGTPGLRAEFAENGFVVCGDDPGDEPDGVVVGFDTTLVY